MAEEAKNQATNEATDAQQPAQRFNIQRIYLKDVSFEAPQSPDIFKEAWEPDVKLDLDTQSKKLAENLYEVVLRLTVTVKNNGPENETAFLCEIQQAGIFLAEGMDDTQLAHCLGAFCPNILFPYARETISSLVVKGTFPQLTLAPVNFDALFMSYLQKEAAKDEQAQEKGASEE